MPAGNLRYKIGFYQRGAAGVSSPPATDYGDTEADWSANANFIVSGNIQPKLGGEQIQAERLAGKNFVNITVRQSTNTNSVGTDWKAKNETTGEVYNIRSIIDPFQNISRHGFYWEMLCEKGVAV